MLQDRVAIVTGAGAGLGRAHGAEAVADEIARGGGEAIAARGSVTDEAAVAAMVSAAHDRWGRVDILVNNAGILRDASFAKMSIADFRSVVDVHLIGAVICTKAVWDGMRAQNRGRIVFTTSSSGLFGNFGQANYSAAKMALVGLMQTLSIEGRKHDIRVNCLAPTAATQMTDGLLPEPVKALMQTELVSPGLLKLVGDDAPTRAILCAGHYERAYVTLTPGAYVGGGPDAAERVASAWDAIGDRAGEIVPEGGTAQGQQEIAAAMKAAS